MAPLHGPPALLLLFTLITGICASPIDRTLIFAPFEEQFTHLLDNDEYDGGAIGVIQNGHLIYANGFGSDFEGNPVTASSSLPVSSLSKTLTALAVLKLYEDGWLDLTERVFGADGILSRFNLNIVDRRMYDITVEHLLRHSGGWDEHKGPVFDPMLNKLYVARGYNIENIEDTIDDDMELYAIDIIKFMADKPLAFAPGTAVKYSNFGYCLLGRVIEEVADMDYDLYVQNHILKPAGMLHTKIGFELAMPGFPQDLKDAALEIDSQLLHSLIDPWLLDSTLGWYSSVQDIARLTISLMYPGVNELLKPETLELMFRRPAIQQWSNPQSWYGVGLHVRNDGAFWQESDRFDNDVILYHIGIRGFVGQYGKQDPSLLSEDITLVALTTNNRFRKLKSAMERLVPFIKEWPVASLTDKSLDDLSDVQIKTDNENILMKYHLPEQHLLAYTNALRMSNYEPLWIHGYRNDDRTHFAVIARKVHNLEDLHFRLEISSFVKKLRDRIHHLEESDNYRVSFLQSYISASHGDDVTHIVLLKKGGDQLVGSKSIRWGIRAQLPDYLSTLMKKTKKGYTVKAQSVSVLDSETTVDFILTKPSPPPIDTSYYASYHDLTLEQLEIVAKSNAVKEFSLQYLDTHQGPNGEEDPRFSAIFTQTKNAKWILQVGVKMENLNSEARNWEARGYLPKILVGYMKNYEINFAALWVM